MSTITTNTLDLIVSSAPILMPLLIAMLGIFVQMRLQFEHKVRYEAWGGFSRSLHDFSSALSEYSGKIQRLGSMHRFQAMPMIGGGDPRQYRIDRWNEIQKAYFNLTSAYIEFLRSYEANQYLFLDLDKMKKTFQKEYGKYLDALLYESFIAKVFPEIYGKTETMSDKEFEDFVDKYWYGVMDVSIFLSEDMRIEFQNHTVAQILRLRVPRRVPNAGHRILTKKGFILQK
jgi:hypothetical protein